MAPMRGYPNRLGLPKVRGVGAGLGQAQQLGASVNGGGGGGGGMNREAAGPNPIRPAQPMDLPEMRNLRDQFADFRRQGVIPGAPAAPAAPPVVQRQHPATAFHAGLEEARGIRGPLEIANMMTQAANQYALQMALPMPKQMPRMPESVREQPVDARFAANPQGWGAFGGKFMQPGAIGRPMMAQVQGWRQGMAPDARAMEENLLAANAPRIDEFGRQRGFRGGGLVGQPQIPDLTNEQWADRRKQHQLDISTEQEARLLAKMGRNGRGPQKQAFGSVRPEEIAELVNSPNAVRQSAIDRAYEKRQEVAIEENVLKATGIEDPATAEEFAARNEAAASEIFDQWSKDSVSSQRALELARKADRNAPSGMRTVEKRLLELMDQWGQNQTTDRERQDWSNKNYSMSNSAM